MCKNFKTGLSLQSLSEVLKAKQGHVFLVTANMFTQVKALFA
jgi:hypothetical protein